jgi:hypothetical protein
VAASPAPGRRRLSHQRGLRIGWHGRIDAPLTVAIRKRADALPRRPRVKEGSQTLRTYHHLRQTHQDRKTLRSNVVYQCNRKTSTRSGSTVSGTGTTAHGSWFQNGARRKIPSFRLRPDSAPSVSAGLFLAWARLGQRKRADALPRRPRVMTGDPYAANLPSNLAKLNQGRNTSQQRVVPMQQENEHPFWFNSVGYRDDGAWELVSVGHFRDQGPPEKEPAVGRRHDFAHNHQRTPRGMARADFSSFYSRSCGHIGARNPRRQRRRQRGRCCVDDRPRYLRHCCNGGRLHRWKRSICSRGGLTRARPAPTRPGRFRFTCAGSVPGGCEPRLR